MQINNQTYTKAVLMGISKRLSSRKDCKNVEYRVIIRNNKIKMNPKVRVYRNRHFRTEGDKILVQDLIYRRYSMLYPECSLIDGTYLYQLSGDKKRRKWKNLKLESLY